MVGAMKRWYGTRPENCRAAISPGIGPCCFQVDQEVGGAFLREYPQEQDLFRQLSNKWYVDLWELNHRQLIRAGLPVGNVAVAEMCTSCRNDLFYSYRRDQGRTGRMAAVMVLGDFLPAV